MKRKLEIVKIENHSFEIKSEAELLKTFRERDQRKVVLQGNVTFPIKAQHYFTWREASGAYVYIIFRKSNWTEPRGLVFKRPSGVNHNAGMCEWCLSLGPSDNIGMLSLSLNSRQSLGIFLCSDLGCIDRLFEAAVLSGKDFDKLANQMFEKIGKLYDTVLIKDKDPEEPYDSMQP